MRGVLWTRMKNRRITRGVEEFNITIPIVGNTLGYEGRQRKDERKKGKEGRHTFPYINGRIQPSPLSLLGTG